MGATKTELMIVMNEAIRPSSNINFSDAQSAAKNAFRAYLGLDENFTLRDIRGKEGMAFAIIEEIIDETLPREIEVRTGDFAEIKQIGRDERAVFKIRTTNASRRRLMNGIQKSARGGIYKARRLDSGDFVINTDTYGVAYTVTLEELLTGARTIRELVTILADAWVELIYVEVFKALSAAAVEAPEVNKVTSGGSEIDEEALDKIIAIVKAYGSPRILGFPQHLAKLSNTVTVPSANNVRPGADADDIRNQGYVSLYKGVPVIELPNYIAAHGDSKVEWVFDEDKILILPADEKPVKVVLQGDSFISEVQLPHGGVEYHQHRMMGVGVVFNKHIGSYKLDNAWDN